MQHQQRNQTSYTPHSRNTSSISVTKDDVGVDRRDINQHQTICTDRPTGGPSPFSTLRTKPPNINSSLKLVYSILHLHLSHLQHRGDEVKEGRELARTHHHGPAQPKDPNRNTISKLELLRVGLSSPWSFPNVSFCFATTANPIYDDPVLHSISFSLEPPMLWIYRVLSRIPTATKPIFT